MRYLSPCLISLLILASCDGNRAKTRASSAPQLRGLRRDSTSNGVRNFDIRSLTLPQLTQVVRTPTGITGSELWTTVASLKISGEERRVLELQLIEGLVGDGRFEEAKDLILSSTGPGERRQGLVFSLFTKYSGPLDEAFSLANANFSSGEEKWSALSGISLNLAGAGGAERIQEYLRAGHKPEHHVAVCIASGLAASLDVSKSGIQYYIDPETPPPVPEGSLPAIFEKNSMLLTHLLADAPEFSGEITGAYLRMTSSISPVLSWQALGKMENYLQGEDQRITVNLVIKNLVKESPSRALDLIKKDGSGSQIATAMEACLKIDPHEVSVWYKANISEMSQSHSDAIVGSLAKHEAHSGELAGARELVSRISDPIQRRAVEGKVWEAERNIIRSEVGKDPTGTLNSLIEGQSKHQDYWIEEALTTWISKEPGKAEEWYQKNWNSLPAAKSQYVAAAYAKEALRLGDPATARQWISLIKDPKTRGRIVASIEKAGSGNAE